jgi:hypothetical protein
MMPNTGSGVRLDHIRRDHQKAFGRHHRLRIAAWPRCFRDNSSSRGR